MRVFLVDFENVKSDGLRCVDCLDTGDQVITFFSKNAESMSMDTYFNLIHSKASFYAVRLDRTGSNALDFQLVSYLGYLMGTAVDQDVFVISKDHGFHSAVSFCRNFLIPQSKYHKTVSQYPSIASLYPNHGEGRAAGINDIPLFLREEQPHISPEVIPQEPKAAPIVVDIPTELPQEEPIAVEAPAEEKAAEIVSEVKAEPVAENKEATPVQPKRRDRNSERRAERPANVERPVPSEPHVQESKSAARSDWDEISAAAEAGLQIIDMFGGAEVKAPKKAEPKKAEEPVIQTNAASAAEPIEIKDFLSPMKKAEPEVKPAEVPVAEPMVSVQPKEESAAEQPKEAPVEEKVETVLSGSEIDRMLEEFLEEAAAAIEAELKEMPEADLSQFIEVETEQEAVADVPKVEEPKEEPAAEVPQKPAVEEEPTEQEPNKERSRRNPRSRKEKQPKEQPKAEPIKEAAAAEAEPESVAKSQEKPSKEAAVSEAPKSKKARKPKQVKEAAPVEELPQVAPNARETVRKALDVTIEIKDEETKNDMEKLVDCILEATGKQDLYRMIIKLFGQKTGLEYYKVVKREYTNICNQIGKK